MATAHSLIWQQPTSKPLESLLLPPKVSSALSSLLSLEKARPVLQGEWGFEQNEAGSGNGGVSAMLWGPPGSGKRTAAAAVAFDLGKPVRLVHFAQLLSAGGSGRGNSGRDHPVSAVFKEARLGDALLMISGIDVTDSPMGREEERALQLLTFEMSRYPGVTLLCCQASIDFDAAVHMLQPDLLRATKAVVQFSLPDAQTRAALWRRLVPSSCPFRGELDAEGLARESEGFSASRIRSCVYSAAGRAVLRSKEAARAEERRPATADGSPDIGPGASAFPHAGAPHALRMKELLEAVRDERDKMIGTRDVLQRSMVL